MRSTEKQKLGIRDELDWIKKNPSLINNFSRHEKYKNAIDIFSSLNTYEDSKDISKFTINKLLAADKQKIEDFKPIEIQLITKGSNMSYLIRNSISVDGNIIYSFDILSLDNITADGVISDRHFVLKLSEILTISMDDDNDTPIFEYGDLHIIIENDTVFVNSDSICKNLLEIKTRTLDNVADKVSDDILDRNEKNKLSFKDKIFNCFRGGKK